MAATYGGAFRRQTACLGYGCSSDGIVLSCYIQYNEDSLTNVVTVSVEPISAEQDASCRSIISDKCGVRRRSLRNFGRHSKGANSITFTEMEW